MQDTVSYESLLSAFDKALVSTGYCASALYKFRVVEEQLKSYMVEKGISDYSSQIGYAFLQERYPVECDGRMIHELPYNTQSAMRAIALLNDYSLHSAFCSPKYLRGRLPLTPEFQSLSEQFGNDLRSVGISEATVYRRRRDLQKLFNYLHSNGLSVAQMSHDTVVDFLGGIINLSDDAVEHHRRTLSLFLNFLYRINYLKEDLSLNMPPKKSLKKSTFPSVWKREDVEKLLSAVDRGNPVGKRDYAVLLLVTKLGLRAGDVKALRLDDINWESSQISLEQSKTGKRVCLPLPFDVGWAIIDYLQHGRPKTDIQNVFVTGRIPIMAFSSASAMGEIVVRYARIANIDISTRKHGMHSLRHTLATRLLESEVPLSTIAEILGHTTTDTVHRYMQVDLPHLQKCALEVDL